MNSSTKLDRQHFYFRSQNSLHIFTQYPKLVFSLWKLPTKTAWWSSHASHWILLNIYQLMQYNVVCNMYSRSMTQGTSFSAVQLIKWFNVFTYCVEYCPSNAPAFGIVQHFQNWQYLHFDSTLVYIELTVNLGSRVPKRENSPVLELSHMLQFGKELSTFTSQTLR